METQDHVFNMLPAYALDYLEEAETELVKAHLETCKCCQAGLEAYQRALDDLPLRMLLSTPPADSKQRLLNRAWLEGRLLNERPPVNNSSETGWVQPMFLPRIWWIVAFVYVLSMWISNILLWWKIQQISRQNS